jgi:hypothetical protein
MESARSFVFGSELAFARGGEITFARLNGVLELRGGQVVIDFGFVFKVEVRHFLCE